MNDPSKKLGLAGRLAHAWINSKLTPLFIVAALAVGAFSVVKLPREEEPQIKVPMLDVFVSMPGASAREVEERATKPMEKLLWEIPGVEYIYSTSSPGQSMAIVRFKVGEDEEASIVKLNQKMYANFDLIPPGCSPPLVKPRSIDDVPILALTLSSQRYDDYALRRVAAQLHDVVTQTDDVSAVNIIGGRRREVRVTLDPVRLAGYNLSPAQVYGMLSAANRKLPAGAFSRDNQEFTLETGSFFTSAEDVQSVVVGVAGGRPVFLRDVAAVVDGGGEPVSYVHTADASSGGFRPAVTIAVSKRKGTNAVTVAEGVLERLEKLKGTVIPAGVDLQVTRQYGETAAEKSNELLYHMAIAVISVSILIGLTLGYREMWVVFLAIPVTLALTLTVFFLYGYTLNRITLFALIFSIGILVDDAIVVIENMVRHARLPENRGRSLKDVAVEAVDEVGNPTILATFTVIAAILPMAFVGGLMGPYMRPIPVGASAAMIFSLLVAFLVTPWAAVRLLKLKEGHGHGEKEGFTTRLYRVVMGGLLHKGLLRWGFLLVVVALLLGAMALVGVKFVQVKMLPFDNKSEFQVVIDMPAGTALEKTDEVARKLASRILTHREVVNVQTYTGAASPYNFNGLVRHYFLRRGGSVADIQVNLQGKGERALQSHDIAKKIRAELTPLAQQFGARIKVAEVPPGPPVLQTLVAEIYGPEERGRIDVAKQVKSVFETTPGVVDVDWYVEDDHLKKEIRLDREKAALQGLTGDDVARSVSLASSGAVAGLLHVDSEKEDVPVVVRLDRSERADLEKVLDLKLAGPGGNLVALREIARVETVPAERSLYHKNLMPVTYVTADVAGIVESPVYAIFDMMARLDKIRLPEGYKLEQLTSRLPDDASRYAVKWDGEWHITYEVFRDMGIAFAAVLVLIYILVVSWFQDFWTPVVIMVAIPFSLVGILPAHGLMGAFFTATSMIGFIAGAGIVVRNSIILVDFVELRLREGMPLDQAVIDAGAVRFRPMLLTAAAVIVGSAVILFDPIFQGLAIALMAGEIASLALSRMTVPILYFMSNRRRKTA